MAYHVAPATHPAVLHGGGPRASDGLSYRGRSASQLSALEMSLRSGEGTDVAAKHAQNMHDSDELQRKLLRLGDGAGAVLRASREEAAPLSSTPAPVPALSPRPAPSARATEE